MLLDRDALPHLQTPSHVHTVSPAVPLLFACALTTATCAPSPLPCCSSSPHPPLACALAAATYTLSPPPCHFSSPCPPPVCALAAATRAPSPLPLLVPLPSPCMCPRRCHPHTISPTPLPLIPLHASPLSPCACPHTATPPLSPQPPHHPICACPCHCHPPPLLHPHALPLLLPPLPLAYTSTIPIFHAPWHVKRRWTGLGGADVACQQDSCALVCAEGGRVRVHCQGR
jgi:hypothetical protein